MSPQRTPGPDVLIQADKLSRALKEASQRGISRRDLATAMAGRGASRQQVDTRKSQLVKWSKAYGGISDENVEVLGRAFAQVGFPGFNADYFRKKREPSSWLEEARQLAREDYHREIQELREQLEEVKRQEARAVRELRREIKKLREAS